MIYTKEVENMCPVAKGAKHEPAPIPEEGKWVHSKKIEDISGFTHGVGWCAPQQGACKLSLNVKNGVIEEALVETIGCSGMTHSAAMAAEILQGKTILEALNTDLVCDAINTAMRELFLQIVYGRTQSAFSDDGLAIGAGLDIAKPCGNMIVDIGGGTTDIAVISLGGSVESTSLKVAGDKFDESIVKYIKKKHNVMIGERTAEDIKIKIGSAYPRPEVVKMNVRGRNLVTGLPKTVEVTSEETEEALKEATSQIVEAVHSVLEKTPPELASDIADRGIVLTGGGSLLSGLEELIESKTGINTMTAEDPMTAVAIGTGKFIEFLAGYRED